MKGRTYSVSVKVEMRSTSPLISTLYNSCLYFIYAIKIYMC